MDSKFTVQNQSARISRAFDWSGVHLVCELVAADCEFVPGISGIICRMISGTTISQEMSWQGVLIVSHDV